MSDGTWTFSCAHHPNLRWIKTKCGPGYMGRGILMFQGDLESGLPANPMIVLSEGGLSRHVLEYQEHYREHYAVECDCPLSDLVTVAKKPLEFPVKEAAC